MPFRLQKIWANAVLPMSYAVGAAENRPPAARHRGN